MKLAVLLSLSLVACGSVAQIDDSGAGEDAAVDAPDAAHEATAPTAECVVGDAGYACNSGLGFAFYQPSNGNTWNCAGPQACKPGYKCVLIDPSSGGPMLDGGTGTCQ